MRKKLLSFPKFEKNPLVLFFNVFVFFLFLLSFF